MKLSKNSSNANNSTNTGLANVNSNNTVSNANTNIGSQLKKNYGFGFIPGPCQKINTNGIVLVD